MWEKELRQVVFTGIYQILFWRGQSTASDIDLDYIFKQINPANSTVNIEDVRSILDVFSENEEKYTQTLEKYLKNWDQTFSIVRSILFTYMLEIENISTKNVDKTKIISQYIRLTENLVGGQNVSLVHAVLSKLSLGVD